MIVERIGLPNRVAVVAARHAAAVHRLEHLAVVIDDPKLLWKPVARGCFADEAVLDRAPEEAIGVSPTVDPCLVAQGLVGARRAGRDKPKITRVAFVVRAALVGGTRAEHGLLGFRQRRRPDGALRLPLGGNCPSTHDLTAEDSPDLGLRPGCPAALAFPRPPSTKKLTSIVEPLTSGGTPDPSRVPCHFANSTLREVLEA